MSEWHETAFGGVLDINPEAPPKAWASEEIRYVDIASVTHETGIAMDRLAPMRFDAAPGRARRRIRSRDVLVSTVRPNLRAFAMVPPALDGEVASTGFAVLRAKPRRVVPGFVWCVVSSDAFVETMTARCTGSNYPAIRPADIASYVLTVPPISEQRRVADVIASVDAHVAALVQEVEAAKIAYRNATDLLWIGEGPGVTARSRLLGEVMWLDLERKTLDPAGVYSSAGVLGSGQGLIDKGVFRGGDTQYDAMNVLRSDHVVMRKLTAWEGPITVVPPEFDGYVASNEFPTFALGEGVSPGWMRHVCRTQKLWDAMKSRVTGTVQRRKRLSPDQLLAVALPIPGLADQQRVAAALDGLELAQLAATRELISLRAFRSALLTALLNQEIEIPESYDRLLEAVS